MADQSGSPKESKIAQDKLAKEKANEPKLPNLNNSHSPEGQSIYEFISIMKKKQRELLF